VWVKDRLYRRPPQVPTLEPLPRIVIIGSIQPYDSLRSFRVTGRRLSVDLERLSNWPPIGRQMVYYYRQGFTDRDTTLWHMQGQNSFR
jgi:hypothetical protein